MTCPHCGTELREHEAGRCLDAWVSVVVFGQPAWTEERPWGVEWLREVPHCGSGLLLPRYSHQITDAWRVVDALQKRGLVVEMTQPGREDAARCALYPLGVAAEADFMALAICKAALLALVTDDAADPSDTAAPPAAPPPRPR